MQPTVDTAKVQTQVHVAPELLALYIYKAARETIMWMDKIIKQKNSILNFLTTN